MVDKLNNISLSNPLEAFCIWNKSIKFKATYLARTVEKSETHASAYDEAVEQFLSCLLDRQLSDRINMQASLPIGYCGLGLDIHSENYFSNQYRGSKAMTYNNVRNITHGEMIPESKNSELRKNFVKLKKSFWTEKFETLINESSEEQKVRLHEWNLAGLNCWLSHIPVSFMPNGILPRKMFMDALLLLFNNTTNNLPSICSAIK